MRSMSFGIAGVVGLIVVVWGGWCWVEEQRYRRELDRAEKDMAGGRYRAARQRFAELTRTRPESGEAAYQLGLCDENLGHAQAALTAVRARVGAPNQQHDHQTGRGKE